MAVMIAGVVGIIALVGWALTRTVEPSQAPPTVNSLPEQAPLSTTSPAAEPPHSPNEGVARIEADELKAKVERGEVTVVDVRDSASYQVGHIPGALHIPMVDVPARMDEIDIDAEVYVVCRQGGRSIQVVAYLNQIGYDAVNVSGGMVAWQHTGRPLTADDGRSAKIY